jgi:short-subunit dehydrogenase
VSNGLGLALARAHAGPGIRLVLIGIDAAVLEQAGSDCRHRGALVETFCASEATADTVSAFLEKVDREAPIDDLLLQLDAAVADRGGIPDTDLCAAMEVVAALAEPMRRRGRGAVVLLSGLAGRSATFDPRAALAARSALVEHGAALRRRLSVDGVAVTIVVPGNVALRSAARLDAPHIAELGVERVGEAIGNGLRWNRDVVSVPGTAVAARRAMRVLFQKLRRAVGDSVPAVTMPEPDPPAMPRAGESASAD